jgi:hypothetical protein
MFVMLYVRFGILLACVKVLYDRIISLREEIFDRKTNLTWQLFNKVTINQGKWTVVYFCVRGIHLNWQYFSNKGLIFSDNCCCSHLYGRAWNKGYHICNKVCFIPCPSPRKSTETLAATLYQVNHDRKHKLCYIWSTKRYILHLQVLLECCYIKMESSQWENKLFLTTEAWN